MNGTADGFGLTSEGGELSTFSSRFSVRRISAGSLSPIALGLELETRGERVDVTIRVIVVGRGGLKWATIANFEQVQTEFRIKCSRQIVNRYQIFI